MGLFGLVVRELLTAPGSAVFGKSFQFLNRTVSELGRLRRLDLYRDRCFLLILKDLLSVENRHYDGAMGKRELNRFPESGIPWGGLTATNELGWPTDREGMFPDIAFEEDSSFPDLWRGIFAENLRVASEPALWRPLGETEQYRFQRSEGGPGALFRIAADERTIIVKQFECLTYDARSTYAIQVNCFPIAPRRLDKLRQIVERGGFWTLSSPRPQDNLGLDGAHYLFEARVGERYHLVTRWSPRGDGFARLCNFCESIYRELTEPRRRWWTFWK